MSSTQRNITGMYSGEFTRKPQLITVQVHCSVFNISITDQYELVTAKCSLSYKLKAPSLHTPHIGSPRLPSSQRLQCIAATLAYIFHACFLLPHPRVDRFVSLSLVQSRTVSPDYKIVVDWLPPHIVSHFVGQTISITSYLPLHFSTQPNGYKVNNDWIYIHM